jgi:dTDP-4-dehydrorhamnose 3,5-epimerase
VTVERTAVEGLLVVRWPMHADERGFFRQTAQSSELAAVLGRPVAWQQTNHARSSPGVLRGFHAEPWDKLIYVVRGTVLAAVADIRPESPTFGDVVTMRLGDPPGDRVALFVGEGLANAYGVVGDVTVDYVYDASSEWSAADRRAVAWDDPDLAVDWPVREPILSVADRTNPTLRQRFPTHQRFTG